MTALQEKLGLVLRRERRQRRLTMDVLAERAGLSLVYLGEIERGKKFPSAPVLERLAWALDLPVHAVLERVAAELRADEQPLPIDMIGAAMPIRPSMSPRSTASRGLESRLAA